MKVIPQLSQAQLRGYLVLGIRYWYRRIFSEFLYFIIPRYIKFGQFPINTNAEYPIPSATKLSVAQSATTSKATGMRIVPGKGRGHLCLWPLIFKKNFFNLCFIESVGFDDYLTDSSLAVSCSLQSKLVLDVRLAHTN